MFGWGGRPSRNLPQVDYTEDSDSDEFVSPSRPVTTRAGSPALLAVPQLNDNVDDDLEEVAYKLHDHQQVVEDIESLTDDLELLDTEVSDKKAAKPNNHLEIVDATSAMMGQNPPSPSPRLE